MLIKRLFFACAALALTSNNSLSQVSLNYTPLNPGKPTPQIGTAVTPESAGATLIGDAQSFLNNKAKGDKLTKAGMEAFQQAQIVLEKRPSGSAAIVEVREIGKQSNPFLQTASGEFRPTVQSTGKDTSDAIVELITQPRLNEAGSIYERIVYIKQPDGSLAWRYILSNEVQAAYDKLQDDFLKSSIEKEENLRNEAAKQNSTGNEQAAQRSRQQADQEKRKREEESDRLDHYREISNKAASGDRRAQQELNTIYEDVERWKHTARVHPEAEPLKIPPRLLPFVQALQIRGELENIQPRRFLISAERRGLISGDVGKIKEKSIEKSLHE